MTKTFKLLIYNNIRRPWDNLNIWIAWKLAGKPTKMCPQIGRLSFEDTHWAEQAALEIKKTNRRSG